MTLHASKTSSYSSCKINHFFVLFSLSPNPFLKPEWKLHRNERRDERLRNEPPGSLANSSPILCGPLPNRSPQNTNTREEPSGFKSLVHVSEGVGTGAMLPGFSPGQSHYLDTRCAPDTKYFTVNHVGTMFTSVLIWAGQ